MNEDFVKILEIHYLSTRSAINVSLEVERDIEVVEVEEGLIYQYDVSSKDEIKEIERQLQSIKEPTGCVTFIIDGQSFLIRLDLIRNINFRWATDKDFSEAE